MVNGLHYKQEDDGSNCTWEFFDLIPFVKSLKLGWLSLCCKNDKIMKSCLPTKQSVKSQQRTWPLYLTQRNKETWNISLKMLPSSGWKIKVRDCLVTHFLLKRKCTLNINKKRFCKCHIGPSFASFFFYYFSKCLNIIIVKMYCYYVYYGLYYLYVDKNNMYINVYMCLYMNSINNGYINSIIIVLYLSIFTFIFLFSVFIFV